jgi:hypothetical protein
LRLLFEKNISYYPRGEINAKELASDFGYPSNLATRFLLKDLKLNKKRIREIFKKVLT